MKVSFSEDFHLKNLFWIVNFVLMAATHWVTFSHQECQTHSSIWIFTQGAEGEFGHPEYKWHLALMCSLGDWVMLEMRCSELLRLSECDSNAGHISFLIFEFGVHLIQIYWCIISLTLLLHSNSATRWSYKKLSFASTRIRTQDLPMQLGWT